VIADLAYERFRRFAGELAREMGTTVEMVFEPIGLMLQPEGSRFDYWCTPTNSVTFAGTGGDGVHFGRLLPDAGAVVPVVMSVPTNDVANLVVAADFMGFLRLGYHRGFFALEQFVYDWEDAVEIHSRPDVDQERQERLLLEPLRAEFALEPPADIAASIKAADEAHSNRLVVPDFDEWCAKHGV